MHKKIRVLIIASILGLLSLSGVQGYLIHNSYKLEKNAFITETRRAISRLDDFAPKLEDINDIWQDDFLNLVADYYVKKITKEEVLSRLKVRVDSLNESYVDNFKKELEKINIGYELKFKKIVIGIIVLDSMHNDTIFNPKISKTFHFLGDKFSEKDSHKVSDSRWYTDHTFNREVDGVVKSITYNLQFGTQDRMNIEGWEKIILRRMIRLLLISIFIFLLVFGLLYYSIKNLITQKKIADIKTDFVNNIRHELKTPLATLTLATKILQNDKKVAASEKSANIVSTIERQNIRLQKLIDQVLNNSLGYHEIKLNKEVVNVNDYLNMIVDDFQLSLDSESIEIIKNIKADKQLFVDKFYFTTAVLNILENAFKYGEEDLKITISANTDACFVVSVSDNGIGIPIKEQSLLFEKFYRFGNKEVHNVKGLGLGLYYTNQIIKAHNGTISIESEVGKGAKFTIEIPFN